MTFDVHIDKTDSLSHHCRDSNFNGLINLMENPDWLCWIILIMY